MSKWTGVDSRERRDVGRRRDGEKKEQTRLRVPVYLSAGQEEEEKVKQSRMRKSLTVQCCC